MQASELLRSSHPLHQNFKAWVAAKGGELTIRQARKYLQKFPALKGLQLRVA